MRAKACTRCRQWKLGCDADKTAPNPCSRCRSLDYRCTFDSNFRRTSKVQQLRELQMEVDSLRQALAQTTKHPGITNSAVHHTVNKTAVAPEPRYVPDRVLGGVFLSETQVKEFFMTFFARCHVYLPFKIGGSSETIFHTCPLLFWVICTVAAPPSLRSQLESPIKELVRDVLEAPGSVETVQALLILCMWPLSFSWNRYDSSFRYSGLAIHIGLQLGLHRPTLVDDFNLENPTAEPDIETKKTTWLACYIISQMQVVRSGLPVPFPEDYTLLSAFDDPSVPPTLSLLCHIHRLSGQSATMIGASGQSPSGILDPIARVNMVKMFSLQFESLWKRLLLHKSDMIEIVFLSSRIQLWPFILYDDIPLSVDVIGMIHQAEEDAMRLLQISSTTNLSLVPFYLCRSLCYAVLVLFKLLKYPCITHRERIRDQIELTRMALHSVVKGDGDARNGIDQLLQAASYLLENQVSPPTKSRMTYSIVFDFIRAYREHCCKQAVDNLPLLDLSDFGVGADTIGLEWDDLNQLYDVPNN
jgi:Fungal specific transcription factor domain/Fungal Zn(2)-Cys(6) binuclear cluster domain